MGIVHQAICDQCHTAVDIGDDDICPYDAYYGPSLPEGWRWVDSPPHVGLFCLACFDVATGRVAAPARVEEPKRELMPGDRFVYALEIRIGAEESRLPANLETADDEEDDESDEDYGSDEDYDYEDEDDSDGDEYGYRDAAERHAAEIADRDRKLEDFVAAATKDALERGRVMPVQMATTEPGFTTIVDVASPDEGGQREAAADDVLGRVPL